MLKMIIKNTLVKLRKSGVQESGSGDCPGGNHPVTYSWAPFFFGVKCEKN